MNKINFGHSFTFGKIKYFSFCIWFAWGSPGSGRSRCAKAGTSFLGPLSAKMVSISLGSYRHHHKKLLYLAIFPIVTRFFASGPIENFQKFHLLQNIVLLLKLAEEGSQRKRYHDINLISTHLYWSMFTHCGLSFLLKSTYFVFPFFSLMFDRSSLKPKPHLGLQPMESKT